MTAQRIELKSLNPEYEDRVFAMSEIAFMHRIIWASVVGVTAGLHVGRKQSYELGEMVL